MMRVNPTYIVLLSLLVTSCALGPNYIRPPMSVPVKFKEAPSGWKYAEPKDQLSRGEWWTIFNDTKLNELEAQVNLHNQNIENALYNYQNARALVKEDQASYLPSITTSLNLNRQQRSSSAFSSGTGGGGVVTTGGTNTTPFDTQNLVVNASWVPDLWGTVRRTVEGQIAATQASAALLGNTQLSSQSLLAQNYFQLRGLDLDQKILNDTVVEYKKALKLTQYRYASGVAARGDVIQAQSQLESAQALAINNGIQRAQYEHAIAVLIGVPPANFSLEFQPINAKPPAIPVEIPSQVLERRPDIAQAERLIAQANAQIGIAEAAYFPSLTLNAQGNRNGLGSIATWLANPLYSWTAGATLAATLFDGGYRDAAVKAAEASYRASVANYRQVVLTAFQNVEDNLVSLRILGAESEVQNRAAADALKSLAIITNQYKSGIVPFTSVIVAQNTAFTAQKTAADVMYLRMVSSVQFIASIGGGW